jgi:hypothetical protein
MNENLIGKAVVDVVVKINRELGPGVLECGGLRAERQVLVLITYGGMRFEEELRADIGNE